MADETRPGGRRARRTRGPAGSGIDPETGAWSPVFEGQRPPIAKGTSLNRRHGGRAVMELRPRAAEIAAELAPLVPGATPAYGPAVGLLGMTLARVERVADVLADMPEGDDEPAGADRLRADLSRLTRNACGLLDALGLTPRSRVQLARDAASAGHAGALREHLEQRYPAVIEAVDG